MKKLWRTFLAAGVMSLIFCLFAGMTVFAEKISGEVIEGIAWEVDTETETLTLTGSGTLPWNELTDEDFLKEKAWGNYIEQIHHVVANGDIYPNSIFDNYLVYDLYTVSGTSGSITWHFDLQKRVLRISGTGVVTAATWESYTAPIPDIGYRPKLLILEDGITEVNLNYGRYQNVDYDADTIQVGKSFQDLGQMQQARKEVIVASEHPNWTVYKGCLYTKDMATLLYCPGGQNSLEFYPGITTIGPYTFSHDMGPSALVIIPWGVTTIEDDAFDYPGAYPYGPEFVLPDTITHMTEDALPGSRYAYARFTYNRNNSLLHSILNGYKGDAEANMGHPVDTVAHYYPDVPEAQGPGPASSPTESKPESSAPASQPESKPESKPESSAPASSTPASQPESKPASKPAESSASSQPPESKPAPESSAPAQSSAPSSEPESSVAPAEKPSAEEPSTEESSIAESSQEESAAENSGESSESEETSEPEGLPTVERKVGGTMLVVLAVVLAAAGGAGVVLLVQKKRKK